ncbi:hypothetical protein C5D04_13950 [Rathayibacter sp. AY1D2]|uniref:hypothetical protein n=1 Tax=unclassified Rathayibacter TaxID=2609250 RepID=UPI000CE92C13|nr:MULTISPECIES: hypothetical protein [unclassified Rathayibacter]PPF72116.1 hypothetical protein C5C46_07515 [Rathayibacter sp. AY1E6]PPH02758.1 hypothetical protein C5C33_15690 [Rathayibacter sp. AY1H3]PPH17940.1 hypothetical protein C5C35_05000 [Rathayibacter sp. AY1F8]PPH76598.1 hypothetical protein C5C90_05010 [Rathayibacter sp. AY1D4]PPH92726.1 hypothetical protein C5C64_04470 [Rathayibacter sp. AY1D3]
MTDSTRATLGGTGRRDRPGRRLAASVLVAVVFALFFAWDVWEAVGNLIGLRSAAALLGTDLNPTGWAVLLVALCMPVLCFTVAVMLGRRRGVLARTGLLAAALCLSAVIALDVQLIFGGMNLFSLS